MKMKSLSKAEVNACSSDQAELTSLLRNASGAIGLPTESPGEIIPLAGDGSDRKFFRVRMGASCFVALISPRIKKEGIDENDSYFLIGKHLERQNLPVPNILWADVDRGHFLLHDLGDYHLQDHVKRGSSDPFGTYRRVLSLLVKLHEVAPEGFRTDFCFDTHTYSPAFVYNRELEYFRKSFLIDFLGMEVSEAELRLDFELLAETAGVNGNSLVMHRDFQSRNIMVSRGRLWIVDFQGMRYGPPAYDLASLVIDPYVSLPTGLQEKLVELYWSSAREFLGCTHRQFRDSYAAVRLSRNLQVLGAYGYLGLSRGKRHFLKYIPRAWQQLYAWINGPCHNRYPSLQELARIVHRTRQARIRNPLQPETFA